MKFFGLFFALLAFFASVPTQVAAVTHGKDYELESVGTILKKVGLPKRCATCGCDCVNPDCTCAECAVRRQLAALIMEKVEQKQKTAHDDELMRIAALNNLRMNQVIEDDAEEGFVMEKLLGSTLLEDEDAEEETSPFVGCNCNCCACEERAQAKKQIFANLLANKMAH